MTSFKQYDLPKGYSVRSDDTGVYWHNDVAGYPALAVYATAAEAAIGAWKDFADHPPRLSENQGFDLVKHLYRQQAFSQRVFGPGSRSKMVLDHIVKEVDEVRENPGDLEEWIDLVLLSFDGASRAGHSPEAIAAGLGSKLAKNESRDWPDWRKSDPDKAIEHVR